MPTPYEILTTPVLLAEVRGWALTTIPPYPASAQELRDSAGLVEATRPDGWLITPYPDGLRCLAVSCVLAWFAGPALDVPVPVFGYALLMFDDQVAVEYFPPGFTIGPSGTKLTWPLDLMVVDGSDAAVA